MATTVPEPATPSREDRSTSILVRFTAAPNVTTEQYDESIRRLEKSGDWLPKGLEYHVAFRSNGNFRVRETRESNSRRSVSALCRC